MACIAVSLPVCSQTYAQSFLADLKAESEAISTIPFTVFVGRTTSFEISCRKRDFPRSVSCNEAIITKLSPLLCPDLRQTWEQIFPRSDDVDFGIDVHQGLANMASFPLLAGARLDFETNDIFLPIHSSFICASETEILESKAQEKETSTEGLRRRIQLTPAALSGNQQVHVGATSSSRTDDNSNTTTSYFATSQFPGQLNVLGNVWNQQWSCTNGWSDSQSKSDCMFNGGIYSRQTSDNTRFVLGDLNIDGAVTSMSGASLFGLGGQWTIAAAKEEEQSTANLEAILFHLTDSQEVFYAYDDANSMRRKSVFPPLLVRRIEVSKTSPELKMTASPSFLVYKLSLRDGVPAVTVFTDWSRTPVETASIKHQSSLVSLESGRYLTTGSGWKTKSGTEEKSPARYTEGSISSSFAGDVSAAGLAIGQDSRSLGFARTNASWHKKKYSLNVRISSSGGGNDPQFLGFSAAVSAGAPLAEDTSAGVGSSYTSSGFTVPHTTLAPSTAASLSESVSVRRKFSSLGGSGSILGSWTWSGKDMALATESYGVSYQTQLGAVNSSFNVSTSRKVPSQAFHPSANISFSWNAWQTEGSISEEEVGVHGRYKYASKEPGLDKLDFRAGVSQRSARKSEKRSTGADATVGRRFPAFQYGATGTLGQQSNKHGSLLSQNASIRGSSGFFFANSSVGVLAGGTNTPFFILPQAEISQDSIVYSSSESGKINRQSGMLPASVTESRILNLGSNGQRRFRLFVNEDDDTGKEISSPEMDPTVYYRRGFVEEN